MYSKERKEKIDRIESIMNKRMDSLKRRMADMHNKYVTLYNRTYAISKRRKSYQNRYMTLLNSVVARYEKLKPYLDIMQKITRFIPRGKSIVMLTPREIHTLKHHLRKNETPWIRKKASFLSAQENALMKRGVVDVSQEVKRA